MWRRASIQAGRVSPTSGPSSASPSSDPYLAVRGAVGARQRQELFSFAVCQLIDAGVVERSALLRVQTTAGRLQWADNSIAPQLEKLRARRAMERAVHGGGE